MTDTQERSLFRKIADGRATEEEFRAFETRLASDPGLRARYVEFMDFEATLYEELATRTTAASVKARKNSRISHTWTYAVASLIIGLVCGFLLPRSPPTESAPSLATGPQPVVPAQMSQGVSPVMTSYYTAAAGPLSQPEVAIVTFVTPTTGLADPQWISVGQRLKPGTVRLDKGELQLDFINGAQLLVQGPAELQIHSIEAVSLISGKAAARVPDSARGFVLNSPGAAVVDLGTEFSVNVDETGRSDVHVTDGEVEVSLLGKDGSTVKSERIQNAEAVRVTRDATSLETVTMEPKDELVIPHRAAPPLLVTGDYVAAVKQAAPFAYWRFEQLLGEQVPNEMGDDFSAMMYSDPQDGPIKVLNGVATFEASNAPRYFSVTGGLPKWNSEEFSIELIGCPRRLHHGALIDILSEDWTGDLNTIEVAMKTSLIHPVGAFRFFHRHPPGQSAKSGINLFDQQTCTPGKWLHIVSTKTRNLLTLSINGREIRRIEGAVGSDEETYQLCLGQMERKSIHRQFEGSLDEVALYSRALSTDEIRRHFELLKIPE